jgi:hypothetical protein
VYIVFAVLNTPQADTSTAFEGENKRMRAKRNFMA